MKRSYVLEMAYAIVGYGNSFDELVQLTLVDQELREIDATLDFVFTAVTR